MTGGGRGSQSGIINLKLSLHDDVKLNEADKKRTLKVKLITQYQKEFE